MGCKELKPTTIKDIIAAMALFRPATMNSGATRSFIQRKHKVEEIPTRHKIIDSNTKNTYGIMVYQEQVIGILRDLGMDADNLTAFLKAVKASNADIGSAGEVIAGYEDQVEKMCDAAGFSHGDILWLWTQIKGFAEYGFNQAHATAYGITAYRCAYLSENHALEFHAALLAIAAGTDKEPLYVRAAKAKELRILKADVNFSDVTYTVDKQKKGIRKGLLALKGIGDNAASEIISNRPEGGFESMEHFCKSVSHRKITGIKAYMESGDMTVGTLGKLYEHGALASLVDE
jgi:DNA polymerase-3 subunit alpha